MCLKVRKGPREADKESQETMLNYLKNIPMIISLIKLGFLKKKSNLIQRIIREFWLL